VQHFHLAFVHDDLHGCGLALALSELYQDQPGRPSGNLKNPKKKCGGVVAVVTRDGAWRIVHPGWQQGQLPGKLMRKAFEHIKSLGGVPNKQKLQAVIKRSTELANQPTNIVKRQKQSQNRDRAARRKMRRL
jgi:hypothetical protein